MSPRITKSRHLDKYPYFIKYDDPSDIPFDRLAKQLSVHPNLLRGMIRSARSNSTIYVALRKIGYKDHQIPKWFARPVKPPVHRWAAPAGHRISAEKRSGVEVRPEPAHEEGVQDNIGVVQTKSAERPSALIVRSALPAYTYRMVQPVYQPPVNPMIEEAHKLLKETQEEEMRASLDRMKRRRAPQRPISLDELQAKAEAYNILWQIEARSVAQMMMTTNMFHASRPSERIDIEEMEESFSRPFEEMRLKKEREREGWKETIKSIGQLFKDCIPNTGPSDYFLQKYEAAVRERHKSDRETLIDLAKLMGENRRRKNIDLELMERRTSKMMENFWKNVDLARARAPVQPSLLGSTHS